MSLLYTIRRKKINIKEDHLCNNFEYRFLAIDKKKLMCDNSFTYFYCFNASN